MEDAAALYFFEAVPVSLPSELEKAALGFLISVGSCANVKAIAVMGSLNLVNILSLNLLFVLGGF